MALTEISYPVTVEGGLYQNKFPSQKPLIFELNRKDAVIDTISSGTDSKVRLEIMTSFIDIQVGDYVTWQSDGYSLRSSRVLVVVNSTTIDVDVPFSTTLASNGFVNYFRDYFLEIRYVEPNSSSDDQDANEILEDYSRIPNQKNGDILAYINLPSDLINPTFEVSQGILTDLFIEFKIQYRESYDINREGDWLSPDLDVKIMLVHGSVDLDGSVFTDSEITKRFIKGYPLIYSMVYSDVNDLGSNNFLISIIEYDISKQIIQTSEVDSIDDLNGVFLIVLNTNDFDSNTRFVSFQYSKTSLELQYDQDQYDHSQYA